MLTRKQAERYEERWLAPYAVRSSQSKGRVYPEPPHPYRTCFQRDRDRIIHSTAFRRLEYKTQVFVIHEGDYYRTRLTHTLEVAQIAETIARVLRLNVDLVRSIALAHDLGHGPFGHSGEEALRSLMADHGGFDHNLQALRIVDLLEERYPSFPGLNLTWEVRWGINKHRAPSAGFPDPLPKQLSLEAQVVDQADELAYDHHDLDDGLTSGILKEEELEGIPLWCKARRRVEKMTRTATPQIRRYAIIRSLIDMRVTDVVQESLRRLGTHRIRHSDQVLEMEESLIGPSPAMQQLLIPLKRFLNEKLYHHHRVVRMANKARRLLTKLFEAYLSDPEQLPDTTRLRLAKEDPYRVICDYIAGMTDRYAIQEYRKLFYPEQPL
jgi:dGTPase